MGRRASVATAAIFFALFVTGCSTAVGQVRGHVLVFGPVVLRPGTTTTLPIAGFKSDVLVMSGNREVASEEVPPGARFHFSLPPGKYNLTTTGVYPLCQASAVIVAGRTTNVNINCVEP